MTSPVQIITSPDPAVRDQSLDAFATAAPLEELLAACDELDVFRRQAENLYERVRALFFLASLHRYHLPARLAGPAAGSDGRPALIPFHGYEQLL
ncbi:MAG TPA: hypothetical protein PKE47_06780, partial [Verrucomicrobiota bacterium]|nr:hypothetical protein [Verrucomicrobiota bacterium]